jgi:hypothetical protein
VSDIVWTNTRVRLGDLKPWQDNPRTSTKAQAKRILRSFEQFGQVAPIAVGPGFEVYDGHQRLSALLTIHGPNFEVEARQSSKMLTDDERRGLVLALANATGSWNWDSLSNWDTSTLSDWGFDKDTLKGWKSDVTALGEFLKSEQAGGADAEPQTDRAAELLEKWGVQSGDLWLIGEHRLICGDCTDAATVARVMDGEKCGACVTDSPYGINREGIENDDPEGLRALMDGCLAVMPITDGVIINFQSPRLFPVWLDAVRAAGHELKRALWMYDENDQTKPWHYWLMCSQIAIISTLGNPEWLETKAHHDTYVIGLSREWRAGGDGNDFAHASVKPVGVVQDVLAHIGGDIYEPFTGSGTSMVAAQNLGRRCFGLEVLPKYVAVALERMSQAFPSLPIRRLDAGG